MNLLSKKSYIHINASSHQRGLASTRLHILTSMRLHADTSSHQCHITVFLNFMSVLGQSLVPSHRSLIRLLRTARIARALRCAHSFARALTSSWDSGFFVQSSKCFESLCPVSLWARGMNTISRLLGVKKTLYMLPIPMN